MHCTLIGLPCAACENTGRLRMSPPTTPLSPSPAQSGSRKTPHIQQQLSRLTALVYCACESRKQPRHQADLVVYRLALLLGDCGAVERAHHPARLPKARGWQETRSLPPCPLCHGVAGAWQRTAVQTCCRRAARLLAMFERYVQAELGGRGLAADCSGLRLEPRSSAIVD